LLLYSTDELDYCAESGAGPSGAIKVCLASPLTGTFCGELPGKRFAGGP
jgi:hypothetical protein